jgi:hypothetical protein
MIRATQWPKQQDWPELNYDVMDDEQHSAEWEYLFLFDHELEAKEREKNRRVATKPKIPSNEERQREQMQHRLEHERKMNLRFQQLQKDKKL